MIESEKLTIRLPKHVMILLRRIGEKQKMTPEQYAERSVVEMVNADIDADQALKNITTDKLTES